jgi:hypothetical protein
LNRAFYRKGGGELKKKVHKSWKLTLGTFSIILLLIGSYVFMIVFINELEDMRKGYTDKIAELEYKLLTCRLNTMNEFGIEDMRVDPVKGGGAQ